jgi:hypothetical protein
MMNVKLRLALVLSVASLLTIGAADVRSAPIGAQGAAKPCKITKPAKNGKKCGRVKVAPAQPPAAPAPARPISECVYGVVPVQPCWE